MKICRQCNINKPLDEYYNAKYNKDGKFSMCKQCVSNLSKQQREGIIDRKTRSYDKLVQIKIDNEEQAKNELLELLGYELNGEMSVHEQFLQRYNL